MRPDKSPEGAEASSSDDELQEIEQFVATDTHQKTFGIIGKQETDSTGSSSWRSYLDREKLLAAYAPRADYPFARFQKTKTINSIGHVGHRLQPRYSDGERKSERELSNLIPALDEHTAVILDSGGAHSVAMAAKLTRDAQYQPVVMFDSIPHSRGRNKSEQESATLLYFAEEMNELKQNVPTDASPVFVLDCHRDDCEIGGNSVKNTYTYEVQDFPSADELKAQGITRIVYLNEGDQNGEIRPDYQSTQRLPKDLKPIVQQWEQQGIKVEYTGISPWGRRDDRELMGTMRWRMYKSFGRPTW